MSVRWALGWLSHGQTDLLGVWPGEVIGSPAWQDIFDDMRERGVEKIRFAVHGDPKEIDSSLWSAFPGAVAVPSIEQLVAASLAQVAPRHRAGIERALRTLAECGGADEAGATIDRLIAAGLGARYAEVVARWRRAVVRLAPVLALPAPLRKVMLKGDGLSQDLQRSLSRAARRGASLDPASVASILAAALMREGRGASLDGRRRSAVTEQNRSRPQVGPRMAVPGF